MESSGIAAWLTSGGPSVFGVLGFSGLVFFLLIAAAAVTALRMRRPALLLGAMSAVGSILVIGTGFAGYLHGFSQIEEALALADPSFASEIRLQGQAEAIRPLYLGLGLGSTLLFASIVVLLWGWRARPGAALPDTAGSDTAGSDTAGSDTTGPDTARPEGSAPPA